MTPTREKGKKKITTRGSNKVLNKTAKIKKLTPSIPVISEETVNLNIENSSKTFWLIDPIDGTRDYIKKKDEYTLNAALIIDFKPAIGIVYAPAKNRLFFSYGKDHAFEINNEKKIVLNCKKVNTNEIRNSIFKIKLMF